MRTTIWVKLIPGVLIAAIAIAGCAQALGRNSQIAAPAVAMDKPPLKIPVSFSSENAKREFAIKAVNDGYYKEAAPLLESSAASQPNPEAYVWLGAARVNMGDSQGAIEAYSKAAELDPKRAGEMNNNIGNALRMSGKVDEAKAAYRKALAVEPSRWTAAANLATMLRIEGKTQDAIAVLEEAIPANKQVGELTSLLEVLRSQQSQIK